MIYNRKLYFTLFVMLLLTFTSFFQQPRGGRTSQILSKNCINLQSKNPKGILLNPKSCTKNEADGNKKVRLKYDSNGYFIDDNGQITPSWYNEELERLGNNNWVKWLAIAKPTLDIIFDEQNKALIFGGEFNDKYSIWVWKPDIKDKDAPPQELSLIDLLAGDKSDKQFANFLKDKNNYNNSRIPDIIKTWHSGKGGQTIKAILPRLCGNKDVSLGDSPSSDRQWEEYFKPFDPTHDQPKCISDALNSGNPPLSFLTVDEKGEYHVWRSAKGTNVLPVPWYKDFQENVKNNKLVGWWAIAKMDNCEVYPIESSKAYVTVCGDSIQCFRFKGDLDFYTPLELLDKRDQRILCGEMKNPSKYENSPIQEFAQKWIRTGEENKIVSYFEDKGINIEQNLKSQLEASLDVYSEKKYYLVEVEESGVRKYKIYDNGSPRDSEWYNSEIHSWRDPWIAKLALVKNIHVTIIDSSEVRSKGLVSFVVSKGNEHFLWSWKLNPNPDNLKEYAPLETIYDISPDKNIKNKYAEAIKNNKSVFFDATLKSNILDHFQNKLWAIRQIYPNTVHVPRSGYAPLTLLESTSTSEIPPPLERAFDNGNRLQYLIEENGDFHIYGNSRVAPSDIVWFQEVHHFNDTWLAWLCLADPTIKVVKSAGTGSPTRLCMISREDRENLWSWVASNAASPRPPAQYHLVKGAEAFELSGNPMGGYIKGLYEQSEQTSEAEKLFFLEKADAPQTFTLSDFLDYPTGSPNRVLLWRKKPDTKTMLRVGVKPDFNTDAIKINLVEGISGLDFWKQIAERYQQKWCAEKFKEKIAREPKPDLEAWFGKERLGLAKGATVGVFLPENCGTYICRDFDFTSFEAIRGKVDDLIYIPKNVPNKDVFFQSWVATKWDTIVWRANPLGYFDRVNL